MKLIRIGSFLFAFALFGFVITFLAFPAMAWQKAKEMVGAQDARHTRRMITRLQVKWGSWLFWHIHRLMRIGLEIDLHGWKNDGGPYLFVVNHTGVLDFLAVLWIASVYGRFDVRWIVKRQMASAPVLGQMAKWSGNAFVARNGDPRDKDAVTACAELAGEDDSSVLIFPEGTRNPYELLVPKQGGWKRMRETLPDYQVLSITIAWFPVTQRSGGRTASQGADLFGKRLLLSARIVPTEDLRDGNWLDAEWLRKKGLIDEWRKRQFFRSLVGNDHPPA